MAGVMLMETVLGSRTIEELNTNVAEQFADLDQEEVASRLNLAKDVSGKSLFNLACIVGNPIIVEWLIDHGAEIKVDRRGYSALHYAAIWGNKDVLAILTTKSNVNPFLLTYQSETARDIAVRYNQEECVEFLHWAEARNKLRGELSSMDECLQDTDKARKLFKEERIYCSNVILAVGHWLTTDPLDITLDDLGKLTEHVNTGFAPFIARCNAEFDEDGKPMKPTTKNRINVSVLPFVSLEIDTPFTVSTSEVMKFKVGKNMELKRSPQGQKRERAAGVRGKRQSPKRSKTKSPPKAKNKSRSPRNRAKAQAKEDGEKQGRDKKSPKKSPSPKKKKSPSSKKKKR